jgi:hypothetical protein
MEKAMRRTSLRCLSLLALASIALACGSDAPATEGAGQADAGADAARPAPPSRSGSVYEQKAAPDGGAVPIENAQVCFVEHPELACVTTDAEGKYAVSSPSPDALAPYGVAFTAAGHLGRVRSAYTWWPSGVGLSSDRDVAGIAGPAGFTYPARGTGLIEVHLLDGGLNQGFAGATVSLSPAAGAGPIYEDPEGVPAPSRRATSSSGRILFGDLAPGRFTLTISAPGRSCGTDGVSGTWPDSGRNVITVPVAAGCITDDVVMWCR